MRPFPIQVNHCQAACWRRVTPRQVAQEPATKIVLINRRLTRFRKSEWP